MPYIILYDDIDGNKVKYKEHNKVIIFKDKKSAKELIELLGLYNAEIVIGFVEKD